MSPLISTVKDDTHKETHQPINLPDKLYEIMKNIDIGSDNLDKYEYDTKDKSLENDMNRH